MQSTNFVSCNAGLVKVVPARTWKNARWTLDGANRIGLRTSHELIRSLPIDFDEIIVLHQSLIVQVSLPLIWLHGSLGTHYLIECKTCIIKLHKCGLDIFMVLKSLIHFEGLVNIRLLQPFFVGFHLLVFAFKFSNELLRLFVEPFILVLSLFHAIIHVSQIVILSL